MPDQTRGKSPLERLAEGFTVSDTRRYVDDDGNGGQRLGRVEINEHEVPPNLDAIRMLHEMETKGRIGGPEDWC